MNLLFYRYGSICEPDIIEGFRELGNQVTEITLEIYNKNLGPLEGLTALKNELFAHSYDFVFSINYYPFISEICNIFQIRYLCWTVDCPVMELYSDTVSNPWNRIFLFDRAQYEEIAPQNPGCIFHLPLASNPSRWHSVLQKASPTEHAKYAGDVTFVGSLYTEKCPYDRLQTDSAYLRGYLEGIMDAQRSIYGCYFLKTCCRILSLPNFARHCPDSTFRRKNPSATTALRWLRFISVPKFLRRNVFAPCSFWEIIIRSRYIPEVIPPVCPSKIKAL